MDTMSPIRFSLVLEFAVLALACHWLIEIQFFGPYDVR
jgi:hypothetical protein